MLRMLLIVLVIFWILGGLPNGPIMHHEYGYGPSGIGGIILLILVVLLLTGRLNF